MSHKRYNLTHITQTVGDAMSDTNQREILAEFLAQSKTSQSVWALQDKESEDWVVLDSPNFENAEVMPVWSSKSLAETHCVQEWQAFTPSEISINDWLDYWLEDLKDDDIVVGVNWAEEGDIVELEVTDFSQALASVQPVKS